MENNKWAFIRFSLALFASSGCLLSAIGLPAQVKYSAWDFPIVVEGNHQIENGLGIGNDFEVLKPITVWSLGVFDHNGDGIQGSAMIKVQLHSSNPDRARKRASGVLLDTALFDAANSGQLAGGFRYKPLVHPITLLPGQYTITAEGFDEQNLDYKKAEKSLTANRPPVHLNDGGGLIRFAGCSHFHAGRFLVRSRMAKDPSAPERAPDRYAAGTFLYSSAPQFDSPFASDYAALTGVKNFPVDTNTPSNYSGRFGSIAVLEEHAFPVIVEPSGSRLILEAAGFYGGDPNGARCVVFAHEQWGHAFNDSRAVQFENAIKWASRKADPAHIVVGLSTNIDAGYFLSRGYLVQWIDPGIAQPDENALAECDALVVDFHGPYTGQFMVRASEFISRGGGIVVTFLPWRYVSGGVQPMFEQVNVLLRPFGLAYRSSLTQPNDFGFTNVNASPYPPLVFNAFPAAALLRENRLGRIQLNGLEKAIAINTLSYAADRRPDLLEALAAVYSGSTNIVAGNWSGNLGSFADGVTLSGAQASSNRIGQWRLDGNDLVSMDSRGGVEYDFEVSLVGVHRIQVFGSENLPQQAQTVFDLILSVDDIPLGQYSFQAPYGTGTLLALFAAKSGQYDFGAGYAMSDRVECLTPFLTPGPHKLKIFWNNARSDFQLRLQKIIVQSPAGPDVDGDGITDWVKGLIDSQSGFDVTNKALFSYTSPMCIEGRDPFPSLMEVQVIGAEKDAPNPTPRPAPNGRWYVNVPLASEGDTAVHASYQKGAKSEVRHIQWLPVNVLEGGNYTVRVGDNMLLIARPENSSGKVEGTMQFTIGTNQFSLSASSQKHYLFSRSGPVTVSGAYTSPDGVSQTGSITVNVVFHQFNKDPACHVGEEREWDVPLSPEATFEADPRLFVESIAQLSGGGRLNGLVMDQSEPRYFLSRLGTNGPVLASGAAQGFDFWAAKDTYLRAVQTYPDGSKLVEALLILNPVLPEVIVQLDVLVGGVVFEDGTTTKQLTRADFDAQGRCAVRFIHPPTFKPAVCHSIKILQGTTVIGRIW